ncbi:Heterokaryon incompatibility protein (HET) domain containing protein [Rhypophila decipiens]
MANSRPFSYSTVPLGDGRNRNIRIVEILPDSSPRSLVQCRLRTVSLQDNPSYEAISYFWGPRYFACSIVCNGANLNVTYSLHGALQRLRDAAHSRWVWADAICIDQSPEAIQERIAQVGMMRDIYESARQVLIWLGDAENNSHQALYIIRQLARHRQTIEALGRPSFWSSEQLDSLGLNLSRGAIQAEWTTLQPFFDRPWFKRIWTVQEVAVARHAVVLCGADEIPWAELVSGLEIGISSRILISKRALNPDTLDFFDPAHAAYLSHQKVLQQSPKYSGYNLDSLLSYLLWFRQREATNPLDKVFALLGLINNHDTIAAAIVPDYNATTEALYTALARQLLQGTHSLDILSTPRSPSPQSSINLPSWVPDWSDSSVRTISLIGQSRFQYSATGSSRSSIQLSPDDDRVLLLKGHIVDTVSTLAPVLEKSDAFYTSPLTSWRDATRQFSTTLDKLSQNQQVLLEWQSLAGAGSGAPAAEVVLETTLRGGLPQDFNMKASYEDWRTKTGGIIHSRGTCPKPLTRPAIRGFSRARCFCRPFRMRGVIGGKGSKNTRPWRMDDGWGRRQRLDFSRFYRGMLGWVILLFCVRAGRRLWF